jgi:hypothetical protein
MRPLRKRQVLEDRQAEAIAESGVYVMRQLLFFIERDELGDFGGLQGGSPRQGR